MSLLSFYSLARPPAVWRQALLGNGWGFLIPYLLLYRLGYQTNGLTQWWLYGFWVVHTLLLGLALSSLRSWRGRGWEPVIFWGALALACLIPGAYLEYPGDPWVHLKRIMDWFHVPLMDEHPAGFKFSYFWWWSWLAPLGPVPPRMALDVVSAATQLLLFFQYHRLLNALGLRGLSARLHVLGLFLLYGTNLFSFRYYALSSTPFSLVAYFAALREGVLWLRGESRGFCLPLLWWLAWDNHKQGALFMGVAAIGLALYVCLSERRFHFRHRTGLLFGAGTLLALVTLWAAAKPGPFLASLPLTTVARWLGTGVIEYGEFRPWLTPWSTFRISSATFGFSETIAIPGAVGLLFASALWRRYPLVSLWSVLPTALLCFPPLVLFICSLSPLGNHYRLLYAFPLVLPLGLGLELGLSWLLKRWRMPDARIPVAGTAIALAVLALIPSSFPWRGRSRFALHRPENQLALVPLDETARWLARERPQLRGCRVYTDDITDFALAAWLGWNSHFPRTERPATPAFSVDSLEHELHRTQACALLTLSPGAEPDFPRSWVGAGSGHWPPALTDLTAATGNLPEVAPLTAHRHGWRVTEVPPYYRLYEWR